MPVWLTTFAARIGLTGLAIAILLALLAVQTVRIEGFKLWPISTEGWKPKAIRLQTDIDNIRKAQEVAQAKAEAAKLKAEQDYRELATRIDDNAKEIRDDALADAERYIAVNRVRCQASGGSPGRPSPTANDNSASGGQRAGSAPELDEVVVQAEDVRICTRNTLQAEAAREWAIGLEAAHTQP